MSSVPMRKMELLLLKSDIDRVLTYLGHQHCFQIIYPEKGEHQVQESKIAGNRSQALESTEKEKLESRLESAKGKLAFIGEFLELSAPARIIEDSCLPDEALLEDIESLYARCRDLKERIEAQKNRVDQLAESLHEVRAFAGLSIPLEQFEKFSYISIQIGRIQKAKLEALQKALGQRAVIIPLDDEGSILAAASRKGRFALETELSKAGFEKKTLPKDSAGVPAGAVSALQQASEVEKLRLAQLFEERTSLAEACAGVWKSMLASIRLKQALILVEARLEQTEWLYRLAGWVPGDRIERIAKDIIDMLGDRVSIRVFDPEEEKGSKEEHHKEVPVLLKQNAFVAAFRDIVLSYGTPLYGDIDPTPLVAFFFTLLFAIMFGDLGQGLVIAGLGLAMLRMNKGFLPRYRQYAPAFIATGLGSMVMGLLDGTCFANEELLVPLERTLTALVLGQPRDRFIQIMPHGSVTSMFYFFAFTLGVGVLINSAGLIVNIINLIRRREYGDALFTKTGLMGALAFWWAVGMGVRAGMGHHLGWIDVAGLGIPLLALFFAEPLKALVEKAQGKKPGRISLVDALVGGAVELIEIVSSYASNTMSFLRVGAFALSHAVLSFVIFTMGELVRGTSSGGLVFELILYVIGNAVIIGLEGLIVAVQVIRLQYYEFFSKFFTRTGKTFAPVSFSE